MKRNLTPLFGLALAGALFFLQGCKCIVDKFSAGMGPEVEATGAVTSENRTVGDFRGIEVGAIIHATYKKGPKSVKVFAQANVLPLVVTRVEGGTLVVDVKGTINNVKEIRVEITNPTLDSVEASGASTVQAEDLSSDSFKAVASGAATLEGKGRIGGLRLDASGSSHLTLSGLRTANVDGTISGAANATLTGTGSDVKLDLSGSGSFEGRLEIKARLVKLGMSGACGVTLTGSTDKLEVDAGGSCQATLDGLAAHDCDAQASGAASIKVNVSGSLKAEASGSGSVAYKGNPAVSRDVSGAGSVGQM